MSRAGRRNSINVPAKDRGKMSKNRWAWCRVYFGQFVIWADYTKDGDDVETDEVADIKLLYPVPNRPSVSWNLTALTVEELDVVQNLINTAIAMARPHCEQRDKEAKDAFEAGDDSHSRIYRAVPQLVYREGSIREYRESLQHGPADAADALQPGVDPGDGVRNVRTDLAEPDQGDISSQDDGPTPNEPTGVRSVGEVGDGSPRVPSPYAKQNTPPSPPRPDGRPGEVAEGGGE